MIKNIFVSFMAFVMTTTFAFAQVPVLKFESRIELVTKPLTVEDVIKKRFRPKSFIYLGEVAKHQGYILTLDDRNAIKSILLQTEASCGSLVKATGASCDEEIISCQKDCNDRVKDVEDRNELLLKEKNSLVKKVKSEERKKIIFSGISAFAGLGLGVLIMSIKK